jgi:(p)ppGpp synthase/HD superfamily hydrolase
MKPTTEDATQLALNVHRGQLDKNGAPYILHPLRVMAQMQTETDRIVAVLHDVVEDSRGKANEVTLDGLRRMGYPKRVVDAIGGVTRREGESYEHFVLRSKHNPISRRVKLADLLDNMDVRRLRRRLSARDLSRLAKYRRAWEELRDDTE